jgi:hypothetical protein
MTVRQLLSNMDSREMSEWMAYIKLDQKDEGKKKTDPVALADDIKTAFKGVQAAKRKRK